MTKKQIKYVRADLLYGVEQVIKELQKHFTTVPESTLNLVLIGYALDWQERINPLNARFLINRAIDISTDSAQEYALKDALSMLTDSSFDSESQKEISCNTPPA